MRFGRSLDINKKAPCEKNGARKPHTPSREECQPATAMAGVLTYGKLLPITVAGPWPIFTAFPRLQACKFVDGESSPVWKLVSTSVPPIRGWDAGPLPSVELVLDYELPLVPDPESLPFWSLSLFLSFLSS